jgi:hypothetical protein
LTDVSDIRIPGDFDDSAPIYATCGDIRKQLTLALQKGGVTQAGFCRAISAASNTPTTPRQLVAFRKKKTSGCLSVDGGNSPIFYASWCYFEKERIKNNKPKSKRRREMEDIWGKTGIPRDGLQPMWLGKDDTLWYDNFGRCIRNGRWLH